MTAFTPVRIAGGFVLIAVAFLAGCGNGEKPTGTVAGKVTYKGSPLTAGSVNLISKSGSAAMAKIDASGQYTVEGALPAGEYTAYATPPQVEPQAPGTKSSAPAKFDLPSKFRDPATSGVTVTVNAGSNDLPIEFKN